jgi:hypothetical protein
MSRRDDAIVAWHEVPRRAPSRRKEFRSYRSSGVAGVGKASSDISMASLIGANKIYAEDVVLAEFRFRVRNTVHISTRNIYGISCARSYRTLRDGSFEDVFPGTSCQATIGVSLRDGLADVSQRHLARERASNSVTPFVGTKTSLTALNLAPFGTGPMSAFLRVLRSPCEIFPSCFGREASKPDSHPRLPSVLDAMVWRPKLHRLVCRFLPG